jgi:2-keto-4-pentenoate hydratase/2-oxohepta-3-ene-1,7-dioic acid hydratase in catechol pathway
VIRAAIFCALLASGCAGGFEPAFDESAPPGLFDEVAIADLDTALTFARTGNDRTRRTLAVTEYRGGTVRGVVLGAKDPIDLVNQLGYDALREKVRTAPEDARVALPASSLVAPVDLADRHVAAATNFPEHAGDAGVEDGPFLFAKLVRPTGPYDPVPAGNALLDYEVEVAWVTLAPLAPGGDPPLLGLVLANDFTDRDTLLRRLDPWDVASGTGFATGKSFPGFLPIGNLFVVPRDHRRFVADLELRLWVDGKLRQRSAATEMVWDFDEIVARTYAWKDRRWDHRGASVSLLGDSEVIPARTLLLSGTPHGTIFDGLRARHYVGGLASWVFGGWSQSVPDNVVAAYIADARSAGAYLRPGNRVAIHVDHMGVLANPIAP